MPPTEGTPGAAPAARASRAAIFREVLEDLRRVSSVRGAFVVAPDGLVIASELPPHMPVEPLGAMAATLGRELELGSARMGRGEFVRGIFAADDGSMFVGASPVGFLVALGDREVDIAQMRTALRKGLEAIQTAWTPPRG